MELGALVATDSDFAVDVFVTEASAQRALAEVLADEPAFAPLLEIVALLPPWLESDNVFAADPG